MKNHPSFVLGATVALRDTESGSVILTTLTSPSCPPVHLFSFALQCLTFINKSGPQKRYWQVSYWRSKPLTWIRGWGCLFVDFSQPRSGIRSSPVASSSSRPPCTPSSPSELHNVNVFTQIKMLVQNLPQKRVNHDWFVFATKCKICVKCAGVWG